MLYCQNIHFLPLKMQFLCIPNKKYASLGFMLPFWSPSWMFGKQEHRFLALAIKYQYMKHKCKLPCFLPVDDDLNDDVESPTAYDYLSFTVEKTRRMPTSAVAWRRSRTQSRSCRRDSRNFRYNVGVRFSPLL